MKKLLLVLWVAVLIAGCTKKPADMVEANPEVETGSIVVDTVEDTTVIVEDDVIVTGTTETTTTGTITTWN